jgi:nucleoid-associated protein YgaU
MTTYTVRKGDTLSAIAQRELGAASRWPEIAELNAIPNPDLIYPGQELRLPGIRDTSGGLISTVIDWFKRQQGKA